MIFFLKRLIFKYSLFFKMILNLEVFVLLKYFCVYIDGKYKYWNLDKNIC